MAWNPVLTFSSAPASFSETRRSRVMDGCVSGSLMMPLSGAPST